MTRPPEPKPLGPYLRDLFVAKAERRRLDARLPFEEKVQIVLELREGVLESSRRRP
jgi:hypothetical protein